MFSLVGNQISEVSLLEVKRLTDRNVRFQEAKPIMLAFLLASSSKLPNELLHVVCVDSLLHLFWRVS